MTPRTRSLDSILSLVAILLLFSTGCRQVERIEERRDLPLRAWNRDLYNSEGVQVYATTSRAAREVAQKAEDAAKLFQRKTGEEPRQILFVAVSNADPIDEELLNAGIQGLSRISGKPIPTLQESMKKEAQRKGTKGIEDNDKVVQAMLSMIPGILESPTPRPPMLWKDAVVIPTATRVNAAVDEILLFLMEKEDMSTLQRILLTPVVAIAKRYVSKILNSVQDAIILGVHAQGREGWSQERVEQLIKETLEESGFEQLGADITNRTKEIRQSNPENTADEDINPE
ncbi:MAG: hypothetical protein VYD70_02970 [Planctomycetota bacterium]|nr:hypothetical protein [Planctomycetota bacterium]